MTFGDSYFGQTAFGGAVIPIHIVTPSGSAMPFTGDDAIAELQRSGNSVRFRYEQLDSSNNSIGWLTGFFQKGGVISHDYKAMIKRSAQVTALDQVADVFDFSSDRLRIWQGVRMPDGSWYDFPLGIFLLSTPTRHKDKGLITRAITMYDQTQVLVDTVMTTVSLYGGYSLPAGTVYTDAILNLLNGCGITNVNITPSDQTLPTDRSWKVGNPSITSQQINDSTVWAMGATVAVIVNDLLLSINYGTLWFDGTGQAQCLPFVAVTDADVDHAYSTDDQSVITPTIDQSLDLFSVPNVIVLAVSQPNRPQLISQFVNSDPTSATSTVNRRRRIVYFDPSSNAADQATLDALARQKAIDCANIYETMSWTSLPMPNHGDRDIIQFVHGDLGIDALYAETKWSLTLQAGGIMTHEMQRVVNIDQSLVGDPTA